MRVAIVGTGQVGAALGVRLAEAGHAVVFGSRDPDRDSVQALAAEVGGEALASADAVEGADAVVLATPWEAAEEVVRSLPLRGKVLLDATNPIGRDFALLKLPTSAAEQIAGWAKGAYVVKAFNTVGAGTMRDAHYGAQAPMMPYCGDHPASKRTAAALIEAVGFEAVDAGGLAQAGLLESLALLWITLAYKQGQGANIAFALLRR